ncbi:protein kinase [Phototrophicus methaneseepsis]|uniref:Protein kinase n=1 Tax=Phototrophicus methaneseepsis TaxID=2710758 RepID=A0A7S8EA77_9CHLR|nr:serine/threonine-protein kinase [Phototrophicus methaneseepsis]QPC83216.1 protein kinase [Phototrophicus methaneseepsis]
MTEQLPGRYVNNRYQLRRLIGRGGMGEVFLAYDRLMQEAVALKRVMLPHGESDLTVPGIDNRLALAMEFQTLGSLRHPNIISVLDYGFDDEEGQPFFTMELLHQPRNIIEAGRDMDVSAKLDHILQLLQALVYLHRRGIIHRDLKPDNVLVVDGQVKVLDFGLAVQRGLATEPPVAGTLAYMAPELLQETPATQASDLYAFGMIAIELLAGEHPFDTHNVANLIQDIYTRIPDLSGLDIRRKLAQLLKGLVAKSLAERHSDATRVLTLYAQAAGVALRESDATRESFLQAARFIGRQHELNDLLEGLDALTEGEGAVVLVGGESGVGKSRLLDEVRMHAMVRGMRVARGQSMQDGGSLYHAWRPIIQRLVLFTPVLAEETAVLKVLVPDIERLLSVPDLPAMGRQSALDQLPAVLEALLRRQTQPLVIFLEDLHWARESVDLLTRVYQGIRQLPVMLIASFRNDEAPDLPSVLPHAHLIELKRLEADEIGELCHSMLGDRVTNQEAVIDLLERESEGNVFFIVEVVRALAEETGRLDLIGTQTLPPTVFARGMKTIIERRLARVPLRDRPLLQIAAVVGRYLDLDVLTYLEPDVDLLHWLTVCSDAAVLDVNEGRWRFAHDKLRGGLFDRIDDEQRLVLHRRVALAIETVYGIVPEQYKRLAYHWGMAGDLEKEAYYASLAAEQMVQAGLNLEAKALYEQALRAITALPQTRERRLQLIDWATRRAEVSFYHPDDSIPEMLDHAMQAAQEVSDVIAVMKVLSAYGTYYYMVGQVNAARDVVTRCLALGHEYGIDRDQTLLDYMMRPYGTLGRTQILSGEFEESIEALDQSIAMGQATQQYHVVSSNLMWKAVSQYMTGNRQQSLQIADRAMQLANVIAHPSQIAGNLSVLAFLDAITGYTEQTEQRATLALEICQKTADVHPQYIARASMGRVYMLLGQERRAAHEFEIALKLAFEKQVYTTVPMFQAWHAETIASSGDWQRAVRLAENALQLAQKTHQRLSEAEVRRALGCIYAEAGMNVMEWQRARTHIRQSIAMFQQMKALPLLANALFQLAQLSYEHDEIESAANAMTQARVLANELDMPWHKVQIAALQGTLGVSGQ